MVVQRGNLPLGLCVLFCPTQLNRGFSPVFDTRHQPKGGGGRRGLLLVGVLDPVNHYREDVRAGSVEGKRSLSVSSKQRTNSEGATRKALDRSHSTPFCRVSCVRIAFPDKDRRQLWVAAMRRGHAVNVRKCRLH